jgi:hypothetical protein
MLYSTPLRIDARTGAVVPGLCRAWSAADNFRGWTFTCRAAPSIAAALRRVARLDAPERWLFADARVSSPTATKLVVTLPFSWRRFPYALTAVAAAPRFVPGPFELVRGSSRMVVLRREGLTVEVQKLAPLAAVRAFRRGELDEAPIPVGDIAALRADQELGRAVRTRTLLGIDRAGIAGYGERLRRIYWQTASRGDYEELIPELTGSAAYGFLGGENERRADFRRAVADIPSLRKLPLWFFVPDDPALRQGALLLYANWRDLGLGPITLRSGSGPDVKVNAGIDRTIAAYAQVEAIPAELVLRDEVGSERLLLRALGAAQQRAPLELLDAEMRRRASAIPLAWVVDARLVSPRLEGWREDALGNVDYAEVRSLASSRSP